MELRWAGVNGYGNARARRYMDREYVYVGVYVTYVYVYVHTRLGWVQRLHILIYTFTSRTVLIVSG